MRKSEVITGLYLILLCFSFVASILLDYKFVSPYSTPQEDLAYLAESVRSQLLSSAAWMLTALLTVLGIPPYLRLFRKNLKGISALNSVFMFVAAGGFLLMAFQGFALHREMAAILASESENLGGYRAVSLLDRYRHEQFFRMIGSSGVAVWAILLGMLRFWLRRFPMSSSVLLIASGPLLLFFNWFDPDHLARTMAMTGIIIGVLIFSVRLINRGILPSPLKEEQPD